MWELCVLRGLQHPPKRDYNLCRRRPKQLRICQRQHLTKFITFPPFSTTHRTESYLQGVWGLSLSLHLLTVVVCGWCGWFDHVSVQIYLLLLCQMLSNCKSFDNIDQTHDLSFWLSKLIQKTWMSCTILMSFYRLIPQDPHLWQTSSLHDKTTNKRDSTYYDIMMIFLTSSFACFNSVKW